MPRGCRSLQTRCIGEIDRIDPAYYIVADGDGHSIARSHVGHTGAEEMVFTTGC